MRAILFLLFTTFLSSSTRADEVRRHRGAFETPKLKTVDIGQPQGSYIPKILTTSAALKASSSAPEKPAATTPTQATVAYTPATPIVPVAPATPPAATSQTSAAPAPAPAAQPAANPAAADAAAAQQAAEQAQQAAQNAQNVNQQAQQNLQLLNQQSADRLNTAAAKLAEKTESFASKLDTLLEKKVPETTKPTPLNAEQAALELRRIFALGLTGEALQKELDAFNAKLSPEVRQQIQDAAGSPSKADKAEASQEGVPLPPGVSQI